jgi:hypothetical protein
MLWDPGSADNTHCTGGGDSTTINTIAIDAKVGLITKTYILNILGNICYSFRGKTTFGFDPQEIGNTSIHSGAAMALFINDVSMAKIMILGRWSSDAFLVYIRLPGVGMVQQHESQNDRR